MSRRPIEVNVLFYLFLLKEGEKMHLKVISMKENL